MKAIKKAGIVAGAVLGGVIGGTLSVIGKVSKKKFVDELGESIIDSSILTGELYGGLANGATEVISGKIKKDQKKVNEGIEDIKESGGAIVGNIIINTKNVIDNSGEVISGIKQKDGRKIIKGVKSLAKYAAVSTITVGSMQIKQSEDEVPDTGKTHLNKDIDLETDIDIDTKTDKDKTKLKDKDKLAEKKEGVS